MNITAPSPLTQWWAHASNASSRAKLAVARHLTSLIQLGATREAGVAVIATWLFRAVANLDEARRVLGKRRAAHGAGAVGARTQP